MQVSCEVPVAPKHSEMGAKPPPVTVTGMPSLHPREPAHYSDMIKVAGSAVPRARYDQRSGDIQGKPVQGNITSLASPVSPHSDMQMPALQSAAVGGNFREPRLLSKNRFFHSYAGIFMESSAVWTQVNHEFASRISAAEFEKSVHSLKMIEHFAILCPMDYIAQGNEKIIVHKQQSSSK